MKNLILILCLLTAATTNGQIISRFTWNSNPVTTAAVGPNAISVSSSATSSTNGVGGTNGLNPGTPTMDVNLTLTGSYYDVPGLDLSIDFRREENEVSFFRRGANFNFYMTGGNLNVSFQLNNGAGGYITINSGTISAVANDHIFHNYHFRYVQSTGIATVWVDGTIRYSYSGTAGRAMYWTGAGNAVVGGMTDAAGNNVAVFDNLVIQNSAILTLPLQLLSFSAEAKNNNVLLTWSTNREINTKLFEIQRSTDGLHFITIDAIFAKGGYSITNNYTYIDSKAINGNNYYRLKMIDSDEKFTYSTVKKVSFLVNKTIITVFPNPAIDFVTLQVNNNQPATFIYSVYTVDGKTIKTGGASLNSGTQQIKIDLTRSTAKEMLLIQLKNITTNQTEVFKVMQR